MLHCIFGEGVSPRCEAAASVLVDGHVHAQRREEGHAHEGERERGSPRQPHHWDSGGGAATYILAFASWRLILALPIQRPSSPLSPVEGELQAAEAGVRGQACSTSDSSTKPRAQTSSATEGDGGGSLDAASDSGRRVE